MEESTRERNKYNEMNSILKLLEMTTKMGAKWERDWSTKNFSALHHLVWNYFDYQSTKEVRMEMADGNMEKRFQ